jgi:hypothetical protein
MTEREDKKLKKLKHRPNQKGVGMRTLNEHDADSYDEYMKNVEEDDDDFLSDEDRWQKLID